MDKYIFYSSPYKIKKNRGRWKKLLWIIPLTCVGVIFFFFKQDYFNISFHKTSSSICNNYQTSQTYLQSHIIKSRPKHNSVEIKEFKVKSGATLTSILSPYLPISEIYYLVKKSKKIYSLSNLIKDHTYRLYFKGRKIQKFEYEIDDLHKITINLSLPDYPISVHKIKYDIQNSFIVATIHSSLFDAVERAGERDSLAVRLADIFAWDIDFIRDIREGDSFKVIVEKRFRKGRFEGYGRILAAEFINQGRPFTAFLYTTTGGRTEYFSKDGVPLRKSFLKAPLKFTRISSRFSYHRFHPILKKILPHLGVDYAAPRGTPIKSVADGIILKASWGKAAGNYIKIRHPNGYITIYNHMCRFARGIKKGVRVKQGQIIGYVGATGYATGPHLDFRVKHNGRFINPLKIKSVPLRPLSPRELARFKAQTAPLLAILESPNRVVAERELKKIPLHEGGSSFQKRM